MSEETKKEDSPTKEERPPSLIHPEPHPLVTHFCGCGAVARYFSYGGAWCNWCAP